MVCNIFAVTVDIVQVNFAAFPNGLLALFAFRALKHFRRGNCSLALSSTSLHLLRRNHVGHVPLFAKNTIRDQQHTWLVPVKAGVFTQQGGIAQLARGLAVITIQGANDVKRLFTTLTITGMKAFTAGVIDKGSSIVLTLTPSKELIAEQEWVISLLPDQIPVKELHVTLMRSAGSDASFPAPPPFVEFSGDAHLVTDGEKTSVYLRATDESQSELSAYAIKLEDSMKASGLRDKDRVFHVSLSNLAGPPGESVSNVWAYPARLLPARPD